jgi:hypothetical protein
MSEENIHLEKLFKKIHLNCIYAIGIPGIVLNIITALIFIFRRFFWTNGNTMGIMYGLQASLSVLPLLTEVIATLVDVDAFFASNLNDLTIKVYRFFKIYTITISLLIQLLITFERWFKLYHNSRHRLIFKIKYILLMAFSIFMIGLLFTYIQTITDKPKSRASPMNTTTTSVNNKNGKPLVFGIFASLFRITTFILMITFNVLLLRIVYRFKNTLEISEARRHDYKSVTVLIVLNFLYLILRLPFFVFLFLNVLNNSKMDMRFTFFLRLSTWLGLVYEALNFFVQIIFNVYFRGEFVKTVVLLVKLYLK